MVRKKETQEAETIKTLTEWLIEKTDTDAYRRGTLSGKKCPKADQNLCNAVGGMSQLIAQAKEIEKDAILGHSGKIKFKWNFATGELLEMHYDVSIIPELCKRIGRKDAREEQLEQIAYIEYWREQVKDYAWILPYYDEILAKLLEGKKVKELKEESEGINREQFFKGLNAVVKQSEPVWERVFSSNVFENSKEFSQKGYRSRIFTILKKHSPLYEEGMKASELFSLHGIHSYAQTLEWKGALQYKIEPDFLIDTAFNRYGTVLNTQTIEHSVPFALPGCKRIMTIENKANYESMEYSSDTLYIFCHGYFTPKEVEFLNKIYKIVSEDCEFYHWGDMDYGGINIFQFIKANLFPKLIPYKMDVTYFDEAVKAGAGIKLEESVREKLEKMDAGLLTELKNRILEKNMTIEQERLL